MIDRGKALQRLAQGNSYPFQGTGHTFDPFVIQYHDGELCLDGDFNAEELRILADFLDPPTAPIHGRDRPTSGNIGATEL